MSKKKESSPAPVPSPQQQAQALLDAQLATAPQSAALSYQILADPKTGVLPTSQLLESTRQQVFPQENEIRNQLAQVILQNLISPTGISPEQQQAINERRSLAQNELVQALRNRQNLGGGLYGGRGIQEEGRAIGDLQRAFAEEDINREERSRLNTIQAALPFLQILFPEVGVTSPQFQSVVQSPDAYSSALVNQRNQDLQSQMQAQQNQSALYSALFSGLGTAVGGALGGPQGAALGGRFGMLAAH